MGQTYPWPSHSDAWAAAHLAALAERVEPYPDKLASTLDPQPARRNGSQPSKEQSVNRPPSVPPQAAAKRPPENAAGATGPPVARPATERHEARVDIEPPQSAQVALSPVRRVVGRPATSRRPDASRDGPAPDSLRELAFLDRVNEIGKADVLPGAREVPRLNDDDYAVLALLDRIGLAPATLIRRAVQPGKAPRTVNDRMVKLHRHGLVARHQTGLREHGRDDGKPPLLYSLTKRGLETAQRREPAPAISARREWREIDQSRAARFAHDLHAAGWAIAFHHAVGTLATDRWRTPRYATGRYPVPQIGSGQRRHPVTLNEIPIPDGQAIIDLELKSFSDVKPDLSLELRIDTIKLTFDVLVELDLTARPSYNREKFLAYDAFLCGWALAHPRYREQRTRPAVVFVCQDARSLLGCAKAADTAMTGRIGVMSTPAEHWYYAGRDHLFFTLENDVHGDDLSALALPPLPPDLRERLTGSSELGMARVELLPPTVVAAARERS
jgi:hypothetical protein